MVPVIPTGDINGCCVQCTAPTAIAMPETSQAQTEFDAKYISASEIAQELGVYRASVHHARRRGDLPNPILVGPNMIFIWERASIRPFIDAWKTRLSKGCNPEMGSILR